MKNYLSVLASLARLFRKRTLIDNILRAPNLEVFQERVIQGLSGLPVKPGIRQSRFNKLLLKEGEKIYNEMTEMTVKLYNIQTELKLLFQSIGTPLYPNPKFIGSRLK